jgi:CarD family transcriptional regulator
MQFEVGDKVVHPHRGPGRIVDIAQTAFSEETKRYYVIETLDYGMTLHIPVRRVDELGVRLAMPQANVSRVLDTLRSRPRLLPQDYKERQASVWEKLRTARPIPIAEAVRDLAWHRHSAHLTKKDEELLKRGQDFLTAEVALVSDTQVSEAGERIQSVLDAAMVAMLERKRREQRLDPAT